MSVSAKRLDLHAVPKTMRAAAIDHTGGPAVLSIRSLSVPELGANEVLTAVDTARVGGWDADMREGWSPSGRTHFPLVLGTDGAGIVAAVGSRVRRFKPSDRVYAYVWDNPKVASTPNTSPSERKPLLTYLNRSTSSMPARFLSQGLLRSRASTTRCM
jgi:NADPH:quinone reductase